VLAALLNVFSRFVVQSAVDGVVFLSMQTLHAL
jgi:hypothetical protein